MKVGGTGGPVESGATAAVPSLPGGVPTPPRPKSRPEPHPGPSPARPPIGRADASTGASPAPDGRGASVLATSPGPAPEDSLLDANLYVDPREGPNVLHSIYAGWLAGAVGRLSSNNFSQMAAHYQNGKFKWDLSLATARGQLVGSAAQTSVVWGLRHALGDRLVGALGEGPGQLATDFLAGAAGGVAMQPSAVRFFLKDDLERAAKRPLSAAAGLRQILAEDPRILARGLPARVAFSGVDWLLYFGVKNGLEKAFPGQDKRKAAVAAATASIVATTPLYQLYVRQIQTGESALQAARSLFSSAGSAGKGVKTSLGRSLAATAWFTAVAIGEKMVVGATAQHLAGKGEEG